MIFIQNHDKPGLIGEIGTILGKNNHNIGNFHLGRKANKEGYAIALIAIDNEVSENSLHEIEKLESVTKVQKLKF
jgi:D-3-phosphoglycerate dehydrogenase